MKTAAEMQPQEGDFAMKKGLSIQEKLKDLRVVEKGFTLKQLADETGIASSTLGSYESDDYKDISHTNLVILAQYYGVSTDWLLGLTESREVQNHDISELHLDDETLDILKSGSLNNRLLCEMIKHPDFLKLMTDTEIYVDGIATMQIKNMNDWLNAVRLQIVQQHNPESNDLYVQVRMFRFWTLPASTKRNTSSITSTAIWIGSFAASVRKTKMPRNPLPLNAPHPTTKRCSGFCSP